MIKLLSMIEAATITAPARLFLDLYDELKAPGKERSGLPDIDPSIVTFVRQETSSIARASGVGEPPPNEFITAARTAGIQVDTVKESFRFDPRVIPALHQVVTRREPQILESQHVKSHFLMRLSGLPKSYPWVAFHHGYTTTDPKTRLYNVLDRWSLRRADRVVTVCGAFAEQLVQNGVSRQRIQVLHSAIRSDWKVDRHAATIPIEKARLGIKPGTRVLLSVGRLSLEKGHIDLTVVLHHLRQMVAGTQVKLLLVGDGPERSAIMRSAEALGLSDQVIFVGQASDVQRYYAVADLLVLPSHSEGSPVVLLEAMMARVPIVATLVGGIPEVLTHNHSALLVYAREPWAMAAAIVRLLQDHELAGRLTENAYADVIRRHSTPVRMNALTGIYSDLARFGKNPARMSNQGRRLRRAS
jgi:glycosyltransferase involved in cell wall biosynthesis